MPERIDSRPARARGRQGAAAIAIVLVLPLLAGCGNVRATLGLDRKPPDEFSVVTRAPLTLPPDAQLRPPREGERDTSENSPIERARKAVFGLNEQQAEVNPAASQGEQSLLRRAGVQEARGNIRQILAEENQQLVEGDQRLIDEILFWRKGKEPRAAVVDASKEAERLRNNSALGLPPTEGETPTYDTGGPATGILDGLF